jgi:hypothetical protein
MCPPWSHRRQLYHQPTRVYHHSGQDRIISRAGKLPRLDKLGEARRAAPQQLAALSLLLPDDSVSPVMQSVAVYFLPGQSQPVSHSFIDQNPAKFLTLWDTGASESYISSSAASSLSDATLVPYPEPVDLRLFDGMPSSAGQITHYLDATI